jgi:hypothetical protein
MKRRRTVAAPNESTLGVGGRTNVSRQVHRQLALLPGMRMVWQALSTGTALVHVDPAAAAHHPAAKSRRAR